MTIERILGTDTRKEAFYKADRNFVVHEEQINNSAANKADRIQPNWITATLQNGWTGDLFYRKNTIGQLEMLFDIVAGTVSDYTTITTFPVDYRPEAHSPITVYINTTGESIDGLVVLPATGELKIRVPASAKIATGNSISTHSFY